MLNYIIFLGILILLMLKYAYQIKSIYIVLSPYKAIILQISKLLFIVSIIHISLLILYGTFLFFTRETKFQIGLQTNKRFLSMSRNFTNLGILSSLVFCLLIFGFIIFNSTWKLLLTMAIVTLALILFKKN